MSDSGSPALTGRRLELRGQLQAQREVIAQQIARGAGRRSPFPRSVTMRVLIQQPELLARLVTLLSGARSPGQVSAIRATFRALSFVGAVGALAPQPLNL